MVNRAILILSLIGVMGCAATVWYGTPTNIKSTTLSLGMSKQQVQALLGPPQQVMSQQLGDLLIETWKYLDKTLTFHNGILQSWVPGPGDQP